MLEKSVVLIDAENLLHSWWDYCESRQTKVNIDYKKLIGILSKDTNLLRAYFYDGISETPSSKKKNFLESLQRSGVQLRIKVLRNRKQVCKKCGDISIREIQKGVDVSLATDILRHAWQKTCSICIIISGDEDYKDAIEVAKDKGVKVWVASFRNSLSAELGKNADKIIFLEKLFEDIQLRPNKNEKFI